MNGSVRIARPFGIEVRVHATFPLLLLWVAVHAARAAGAQAALGSAAFVLGLFACVVLHELGHSRVAMAFGVPVRRITLYPIGGMAAMARIPRRPREELLMALAGPAVNAVIAAALWAARGWPDLARLEPFPASAGALLDMLLLGNVLLVAFNLLPAFPMDGGRVLRSLLAQVQPYGTATAYAAAVGQLMAVGFGVLGLRHGNPFLPVMAVVLVLVARREAAAARQREWIERRRPAERMRPLRPALAPEEPLSRCPALWQATGRSDFPVLFEDRVVGLMPRERWQRALRRLGPEAPVGEAMERRFYAVPADEECTEQVAALLAAHQIPIPVVRDGQAVGVLIPDEREDAARPVAATGRWTLDLGPA